MQPDISIADPCEKPTFGGYAEESPRMKVQRVDAVVELVEVGLPQQPVPPGHRERWMGQQEKVSEPLLLWPEGGDQSWRDWGSL